MAGLLHDNGLNNVLAVKTPGLTQERFDTFVVVVRAVDEVRRVEAIGIQRNGLGIGPAGEGPGRHS